MKYFKLFELVGYLFGMYYALIQLAKQNNISFTAFVFLGYLCGFVFQSVNIGIERNKQV